MGDQSIVDRVTEAVVDEIIARGFIEAMINGYLDKFFERIERMPIHNNSVLKRYRKENGYTQADVGDALGITEAYYNQIERGKKPLTVHNLIKICKLYRVSANKIIDELEGEYNG